MRTFQFSDARSHKFWTIDLQGASFTVTYGRVGGAAQTQTKTFATPAKAQEAHDKLVAEKVGKGYVETTPTARPPAASLRDALEQALVENPDDLASHMAYADHLADQDDPRGDFIRVQLALEDPKRPETERAALNKQQAKLLADHAVTWLGTLAPFLTPDKKKKRGVDQPDCQYGFARGWLDMIQVSQFDSRFAQALAQAPEARLLRRLIVHDQAYEEPDSYGTLKGVPEDSDVPALWCLQGSPVLNNLRVLQVGEQVDQDEDYYNSSISGEAVAAVVKHLPRLEELLVLAQDVDTDELFGLKSLNNLRVLQVYHMDNYPLTKLARNPSLGKLTHLLFFPHAMVDDEPYLRLPGLRALARSKELPALTHLQLRMSDFGDKGAEEIVSSGLLKRLKLLDLRNGCMTDDGARTLAACPDFRNLEVFEIGRNCLTAVGLTALRATGVTIRDTNGQWSPSGDEHRDREYLYEGDGE